MDQIVNNIQLTWKLAWMLRTYRIYNSTVKFSKYEFYNKLLDGVILLRITPGVNWIQLIYIYIYIYKKLDFLYKIFLQLLYFTATSRFSLISLVDYSITFFFSLEEKT